ncbi:type II secretion system protein GspG [candidate division KSB1 bacterium]
MKDMIKVQAGFTMMEIVIVIVILGILSVIAVPKIGDFITTSKIEATKNEMMILKAALVGEDGYRIDVGSLPAPADIPDALLTRPAGVPPYDKYTGIGWNGPYINDDGTGFYNTDAWGNAYVYTSSTITSYGPGGASGGGDDIVLNY